jgi:hypothetical protein
VAEGGRVKRQDTITDQIIAVIAKRVGIHMTPHQFRHLGATSYLAANPEDFETVTQMLGQRGVRPTASTPASAANEPSGPITGCYSSSVRGGQRVISAMDVPKHLALSEWPDGDHAAFAARLRPRRYL